MWKRFRSSRDFSNQFTFAGVFWGSGGTPPNVWSALVSKSPEWQFSEGEFCLEQGGSINLAAQRGSTPWPINLPFEIGSSLWKKGDSAWLGSFSWPLSCKNGHNPPRLPMHWPNAGKVSLIGLLCAKLSHTFQR